MSDKLIYTLSRITVSLNLTFGVERSFSRSNKLKIRTTHYKSKSGYFCILKLTFLEKWSCLPCVVRWETSCRYESPDIGSAGLKSRNNPVRLQPPNMQTHDLTASSWKQSEHRSVELFAWIRSASTRGRLIATSMIAMQRNCTRQCHNHIFACIGWCLES